ncbi:FHA domain-containing protein [Nocardioides conyzicola]|uniref:FHA domain-containing protein n=1 Tax=Nocardioides conyzicola TaxID=1651781 RepID=A0ABP8Y2K1_9ACTN
MPFCTVCGTQNPDDARFCAQCGNRLQTAQPVPDAEPSGESTATISIGAADKAETSDRQLNAVDAAAVDALPSGHALLVVQRGPGSGSRFLLDQDVVSAGRHPESEIFLDDVTVSRRHAEFHRQGDSFTVSDVGSLNGTYVNRDRIDRVRLNDGDEVQIGKFRLVFFSGRTDG